MSDALRPLLLGLGLIALVSGLLLYGDLPNRNRHLARPKAVATSPTPTATQTQAPTVSPQTEPIPVALMQAVATPLMDDALRGLVRALDERGYRDGGRIRFSRFNADGSADTANSIGTMMVGGSYKLLLTFTTTSMQVLYRTNRQTQLPHVFGVVSDPSASNVGVKKLPASGADKPAWMAGLGSMQPVEAIFRAAKKLNPDLKSVGVVWNNAEINSELTVLVARKICAELGITLVEATVQGTSEVGQAADSLAARSVQAIWTGGDALVASAMPALTSSAARNGIPVFSNVSGNAFQGSMFDLGADFEEVGYAMGQVAADVLDGKSTADMTIKNYMPERIIINYKAWAAIRDRDAWKFPDDFVKSASIVIREDGTREDRKVAAKGPALPAIQKPAPSAATTAPVQPRETEAARVARLRPAKPPGAPLAQKWKLKVVTLVEAPSIDQTYQGMLQGLKDAGLVEGRDYEVSLASAQGDMSTLSNLIDVAQQQGDMVMTITTPALQTALQRVTTKPVIFALALDPLLVGDKGTHTQHRENVAGIYDRSPFEAMVKLLKELKPGLKKVGTLFAPGEVNSLNFREEFGKAAQSGGLELVVEPSTAPNEVPLAATTLLGKGPEFVVQINDNLHDATFAAIANAARRESKPLMSFATGFIKAGAVLSLANDHFQAGWDASQLAARVMRGESPASMPYVGVSNTLLAINLNTAKEVGLSIPAEILARADEVVGDVPAAATTAPAPAPAPATTSAPPAADSAPLKTGPPTLGPGGRPWRIFIMNYNDTLPAEETTHGFVEGMKKAGWEEGKHFTWRMASGHGDLATVAALVDQAIKEDSDLIVPISTPSLQTALKKWPENLPIVFGYIGNPMYAGAGKSYTDHKPNVTGLSSVSAFKEMCAVLNEHFPHIKRIGTLFTPGEINSVYYADELEAAGKQYGIHVERVGVNAAQEIVDGTNILCSRGIDAIVQISDNLISAGFKGVAKAAKVNKMPIFSFQSGQVKDGAVLAYSRDFHDGGVEMAAIATRILSGTSPADIPFANIRRTRVIIDLKNAAEEGITIPEALLRKADEVRNKP